MAAAAFFLEHFNDPALTSEDLLSRLAWLRDVISPRLQRFLGYYRNPVTDLAAVLPCGPAASFLVRPFRQYQELGLPARITGFRRAADGSCSATGAIDVQRKEVVIENDIAWRMDTLVDFAAARMPGITSTAQDPKLRAQLNDVITQILQSTCGCLQLLQTLVLQGCIGGSAWVQVRPSAALLARLGAATRVPDAPIAAGGSTGSSTSPSSAAAAPLEISQWLQLEIIEAWRIMRVASCVAVLRECTPASGKTAGLLDRLRTWLGKSPDLLSNAQDFSFDVIGPALWQRYDQGILTEESENPLGVVPFVRYENAPDPAAGTRVGPAGSAAVNAGIGDVEPLIGMQDELNTRLSDRAYRVTMTSFRMYLGKGIEDFIKRPIGPGQMWGTDNPDASVETFGGDQSAPSEESHINEVRDALDKISGVSPVAAGLVRGKLGNLTSAVALRLTLIALLARTERKRVALQQAMSEIVRHALRMLDMAGLVKTTEQDRDIDVNWPTALPESDMDRLAEAQTKLALGLPRSVVLTELGYGELVTLPEPVTPPEPTVPALATSADTTAHAA